MTKPFDHWISYFHTPSRKTPIGIHILSHSWYRARHAAEVVATRIGGRFPRRLPGTAEVAVTRAAHLLERQGPADAADAGWVGRGDYIAVADEAGGIKVFRVLKGHTPVSWAVKASVEDDMEEL